MISIIPYASSSEGNCYLIKKDNDRYLLECGIPKKEIERNLYTSRLMISDLKGCFITHHHSDHSNSCHYVNEYMPIFANADVINKFSLDGDILSHNQVFEINGLKVLPFNVNHGETANLGFVFRDEQSTIMFATDLMNFESNLSRIKFNKIFIECNYDDSVADECLTFMNSEQDKNKKKKYQRQINTHMSLNNLKVHLRTLDLSECNEIVLLHHSKFMLSKRKAKSEIEHEFKIKTNFAKKGEKNNV